MSNKKDIDFRISLDETQIIKGIAVCCLLWIHLFIRHDYGDFFNQITLFCKVAISLFLFVSAYGLTVQYAKIYNKPIKETFKFQAKRYVKLYSNFWVIFLIFVPLGVFVFGRELSVAYNSTNAIPIKSFIRDFLGISGANAYNVDWWFNTLIISLYFLFPVLYFVAKKWTIPFLIASAILWNFDLGVLPYNVHWYMFHFAVGIVYALHIDKVNRFLNRFNFWVLLALLFLILGLLYSTQVFFYDQTPLDGITALTIILITILLSRKITRIGVFKFLGKHSMNLFWTHKFVYFYFFSEFIYSFKHPVVIFLVLLAICLIMSVIIEYGKEKAKLPILVKKIINKIDNK